MRIIAAKGRMVVSILETGSGAGACARTKDNNEFIVKPLIMIIIERNNNKKRRSNAL